MWLLKRKNKGGQLMITITLKNPLTLKIMMGLQSSLFSRPTGKKKRMRFSTRTSWLLIRIRGSSSGEVQLKLKIHFSVVPPYETDKDVSWEAWKLKTDFRQTLQ
jgi:hypothetical protein